MAAEQRIIAALTRWGCLTDDLIAGYTGIPKRVAKATRRRLVKRGDVVAGKVHCGRMAWRAI